jgi:hypothetical protein
MARSTSKPAIFHDETLMVRLKPWQWAVLGITDVLVVGFLLIAAGLQIQ